MHQVWEAQATTSRGPQPIAPPPPPLASSQPTFLTNPFTLQGYLAVQPTQGHAALPPPPSIWSQ